MTFPLQSIFPPNLMPAEAQMCAHNKQLTDMFRKTFKKLEIFCCVVSTVADCL